MGIWQKEFLRLFLLYTLSATIGGLIDLFWPLLFFVTFILLIRQWLAINQFEQWIGSGGRGQYPKARGIWEEIYYHVYRIKKNEKRRKKKLSKMIEQFRQSTEALPDAAVVLGADDEIEWANKTAREILGLQQSDKGQRILNLVRFPDFVRYLKAGDYSDTVMMPSPVNNQITLSVRVVSYGAGLRLLVAQDVTQLKIMERMRKDFVANVSHELRTPLTVLKGYLETLEDLDDNQSALLTNSVAQMKGQTERMQQLVDDLLLLTRLETQQRKTQCINVPAMLEDTCKEYQPLNHHRIVLTLDCSTCITGEEQALRSTFSNLISNALKYSPDDSPVNVRWYETNEAFVLSVEDQGEGIAANEIPRISERFYRIETRRDKKIPGTGLGLAIVKHALVRHDAKLTIRSQLDKGSCFSCEFPKSLLCQPLSKSPENLFSIHNDLV